VPRPVTTPFDGPPVGFDRLYGLELLEVGEGEVRAQVEVRDELLEPGGRVHGGVLAAIAESITSIATRQAVELDGRTAQGTAHQATFLHAITGGTIHAVARRRHGGRTTWVWEVEIADDEGRLCALARTTVAVR
jgi:1,4-dihydroxy-2-naphthoyl-CoA hydrolase